MRVGKSFNLYGTFNSSLVEKRTVNEVEETLYRVKWNLKNYGKRSQEAEIRVPLSQYSEVRDASYRLDGNEAVFALSLGPGESRSVEFTYVTKNPWVRPY